MILSETGSEAQDLLALKLSVKAARDGDEEKVRQALLKRESPDQVDSAGQPLLIIAVMAGDLAETLLKVGATVDAVDSEGKSLLDKKADLDTPDFTGRTPLACARQSGLPAMEALLRKAGGRE